jgi:hypothetical protein
MAEKVYQGIGRPAASSDLLAIELLKCPVLMLNFTGVRKAVPILLTNPYPGNDLICIYLTTAL